MSNVVAFPQSSTNMRPSVEVLVEFCAFIGRQRPGQNCWPNVQTENTQTRWQEIAAAFRAGLAAYLPWMEPHGQHKTLLRAALDTHNQGPNAKEFPDPFVLNEVARSLHQAARAELEAAQPRSEKTAEEMDTSARFCRLLAHRGVMKLNPNNPYASDDGLAEVLKWAEAKGLPCDRLPRSGLFGGSERSDRERF